MKKIGIVFDCDGTLVDTEDQVIESMNYALEKTNSPAHTSKEIKSLFGPGADQILLKLIGDEHKAELAFEYFLESQTHLASSMKVYDGIRELLNHLKESGTPMGLVTGRHSRDLEIVLKAHQLKDYFYVIVADDDLKLPKPSPEGLLNAAYLMKLDPESLYYIGDAKTDIQTAQKAKSQSVAALWDKRVDSEIMRLEGPSFMALHPMEIWNLVSKHS